MKAFVDTLAGGERIVTVKAEIVDNVYPSPQSMYALAKKHVNNPKRLARSATEDFHYTVYSERINNG